MIDRLDKFYCGVSFQDKADFIDRVKQTSKTLGTNFIAEFDKSSKCWCIVSKTSVNFDSKNLVLLGKYLPKAIDYSKNLEHALDVEQFFLKNLMNNGYEVTRLEICKNAKDWKRCKVFGDKGKEKSGGYVFLTDYTGFKTLLYKNFRESDTTHKLTTKDFMQTEKNIDFKKQSPQDQLCNQALLLNKKTLQENEHKKEEQKKRVALQQLLQNMINELSIARNSNSNKKKFENLNPYIIHKKLENSDKFYIATKDIKHPTENYICCPKNSIVIPIVNIITNEIINLQIITPKLEKRFLKGYSLTNGCILVNRDDEQHLLNSNSAIVLCEGFATANTVYSHFREIMPRLTSVPYIYSCLNCSGMVNFARTLNEQYGITNFIVCADNDHETALKIGRNPGLDAFCEIKSFAIDSTVYYPPDTKGCSDWNDYFNLHG